MSRHDRGPLSRSAHPRNPSENGRFGAEVSAHDWMVCCAPRMHYPAPNTAPKSGLAFRRRNRAQKVERAARKTLAGFTEAWAGVAAPGFGPRRWQYPTTKLRFATTAAITTCQRVFFFPK